MHRKITALIVAAFTLMSILNTGTVYVSADELTYKNRSVGFRVGGTGSISTNVDGVTSLVDGQVGSYLSCNIDIETPGDYTIEVGARTHNSRGIMQLSIDGENAGDPVDLYTSSLDENKRLTIGTVTINDAGVKDFRFTVTGKNEASSGYILSLLDIYLIEGGKSSAKAAGEQITFGNRTVGFRVAGTGSMSQNVANMTSITDCTVGSYLECDIGVPEAGRYLIEATVRTDKNRGVMRLVIDGNEVGENVDTYSSSQKSNVRVKFGTYEFDSAGKKPFRFVVKGKNAASSDYILSLYDIYLTPVEGSSMGEQSGTNITKSTYKDLLGHANEDEILLLKNLGLFGGYSDNTFRPDATLTRAEFSVIAARMLNLNDLVAVEQRFSDLPLTYWAAGSIYTLCELGYINGYTDGTFRPEEPVTLIQTVKILTEICGYGVLAQQSGGYPNGYLEAASRSGILRNSTTPLEDSVTRAEAAMLVYRTVMAPILERVGFGEPATYQEGSKTVLSKYLSVERATGIVDGTHDSSIYGESSLRSGRVSINKKEYYVGKTDVEDFLGCNMEFYYKVDEDDNDIPTLLDVSYDERKNEIVIAENSMIMNCRELSDGSFEFEYWQDADNSDRTETAKISPFVSVIYNGRYDGMFSAADFKPEIGSVRLIDNDQDSEYDIAIIKDYKSFVVSGINAAEGIISSKDKDKESLVVDPSSSEYDVRFIKKGKETRISSIAEWNVLLVAQSRWRSGKLYTEILINDAKVEGIVSEVTEGDIVMCTIDGTKYNVSPQYYGSKLEVNKKGIFYIDYFGNIAASDKGDIQTKNYAFLMNMGVSIGVAAQVDLKVFTADAQIQKLNLAKKLSLDGNSIPREKAMEETTNWQAGEWKNALIFGGAVKPQLIYYETNNDGEVRLIDTDFVGPKEEEKETLTSKAYSSATYVSSGKSLNAVLNFDSPVIFQVPTVDGNEVNPDVSEDAESEYKIGTTAFFANNNKYTVIAYNVSDVKTVKLAVHLAGKPNTARSALMLVDKKSKAIDSEENTVCKLYGLMNGNTTGILCTPAYTKRVDALPRGSVIQYGVDSRGRLSSLEVVYEPNNSDYTYAFPSSLISGRRITRGWVENKDGDNISVSINNIIGNPDGTERPYCVTGATIMKYDPAAPENLRVSVANSADISVGDEIVIRSNDSKTLDVIIIKR